MGHRAPALFPACLAFACSAGAEPAVPAADDFLDRLAGAWTLTGTMGSTELRQKVDARWIVGGRFLQVHFVGARHGHSVDFLFEYPSGSFSNEFTWHPETGPWGMVRRQRRETGEGANFATKTLTRDGTR